MINKEGKTLIDYGVYDFVSLSLHKVNFKEDARFKEQGKELKGTLYELRSKESPNIPFPLWANGKSAQTSLFPGDRLMVWSESARAFGYIDSALQEVIAPQFVGASYFGDKSTALVAKGTEFGNIDKAGTFEPDGIPCLYLYKADMGSSKISKVGTNLNIALDTRFDTVDEKSPDLLAKRKDNDSHDFCENAQWSFIRVQPNGNLSVSAQTYSRIDDTAFSDHYYIYKNGKVGLLKNDNTVVFEPKHHKIMTRALDTDSGKLRFVILQDNKLYKLYFVDGSPIWSQGLEDFDLSAQGALIKTAGKWGLVDYHQHLLYPAQIESRWNYFAKDQKPFVDASRPIAVKKDGKWGVMNWDASMLLDFQYEKIDAMYPDLVVIYKKGKLGAVNEDNQTVVPFMYDSIGVFNGGRAEAVLGGKNVYVYANPQAEAQWTKIEEQERLDRQREKEEQAQRQREQAAQNERERRQRVQQEIDELSQKISKVNEEIQSNNKYRRINPDMTLYQDKDRALQEDRKELERRLREKERERRDMATSGQAATDNTERSLRVQQEIDELSQKISKVNEEIQSNNKYRRISPDMTIYQDKDRALQEERKELERRLREKERERRDIANGF